MTARSDGTQPHFYPPTRRAVVRDGDPFSDADCLEFFDAALVSWRVMERDTSHDPGAPGDHCLVFASLDSVRRVWVYPIDWRDLGTEALIALSWGR